MKLRFGSYREPPRAGVDIRWYGAATRDRGCPPVRFLVFPTPDGPKGRPRVESAEASSTSCRRRRAGNCKEALTLPFNGAAPQPPVGLREASKRQRKRAPKSTGRPLAAAGGALHVLPETNDVTVTVKVTKTENHCSIHIQHRPRHQTDSDQSHSHSIEQDVEFVTLQ
jgi:hypothetical protein